MLDFIFKIPVKGIDQALAACQRLKGHRRDELCAVRREHHCHGISLLYKAPGDVGSLVGRDRARDSKKDVLFSIQHTILSFCIFSE